MDTLTARAREIFPIIELYLKSDLSQKQFALSQEMTYPSFLKWLTVYRKHHKSAGKQHFKAVQIKPSTHSQACEISYPNGIVLSFDKAPEASELLSLVRDFQ